MDYKKVINQIIANPSNQLTKTTVDLLQALSVRIDLDLGSDNHKEINKVSMQGFFELLESFPDLQDGRCTPEELRDFADEWYWEKAHPIKKYLLSKLK